MNYGEYRYIWQRPDWPNWRYDLAALVEPIARVSRTQGLLAGRLAEAGFNEREEASLAALTEDVVRSSEIEGEQLDLASVRSSVARQLGVESAALLPPDRKVDAVVEMALDATRRFREPVTRERLLGWQVALFPTGYAGMHAVRIGSWRDDANGPMRVVWGPIERPRVHYEAPPAARLEDEMARLLAWLEGPADEPALLRAGIAHLWFVTLHPFEDGNGRVARALGDLMLARADGGSQRFYSLSAQLLRERNAYYEILERTQKGTLDVTPWLSWFLAALQRAMEDAHRTVDRVLAKAHFWRRVAQVPMNERQLKVLNRVLDGFQGKLTSGKWASLAKCSPDTALRDINDLVAKGVLRRSSAGGRSTSYEVVNDAD